MVKFIQVIQMSKLYNSYLELKKKNSNSIYLFKSGIFFIALDEDAKTLSNLFNLKLSNFTPTVIKCGFPCSSFEKYSKLFAACNLDIKLIESGQPTTSPLKNYNQNSQIGEIINSIKAIDINSLSIQEAYKFIENLQKQIKEISCEKEK